MGHTAKVQWGLALNIDRTPVLRVTCLCDPPPPMFRLDLSAICAIINSAEINMNETAVGWRLFTDNPVRVVLSSFAEDVFLEIEESGTEMEVHPLLTLFSSSLLRNSSSLPRHTLSGLLCQGTTVWLLSLYQTQLSEEDKLWADILCIRHNDILSNYCRQ